jgi:Tfp pilus assembly protein PilO
MRLTRSQQQLLIVVAIVGVIYLFYSNIVKPKREEIKRLRGDLQTKITQRQEYEREAARFPTVVAEGEMLKLQLKYIEELLPKEKNMPELIRLITSICLEYGIKFTSFSPQAVVSKPEYDEIPIGLPISVDSYHILCQFLSGISKLPRLLVPHISHISYSEREEGYQLDVGFRISAYVYKPGG